MTDSGDSSTFPRLVAMPREALALLRDTLLREGGPAAASFLQESGYAGGEQLCDEFAQWLAERGHASMGELSIDAFSESVSGFFSSIGWGSFSLVRLNGAVAALDSADLWEAGSMSGMDHPGCHVTTGVLADLLGRVSGAPLAVLEVECRSMGSPSCRFLTGSAEALERVYETMMRGLPYGGAVDALVE